MPSGHLIKRAEQAQCRAGAVPSWHLTKRAEQAQAPRCRAGARRAEQALDVPSRHSRHRAKQTQLRRGGRCES